MLGESYPSAETQSVYSTASVDWADIVYSHNRTHVGGVLSLWRDAVGEFNSLSWLGHEKRIKKGRKKEVLCFHAIIPWPVIDMQLTKSWTAIIRLSVIWKSDLTDKMKQSFFQAVIVSILQYGCTTWTLTKQLEKKLDANSQECCEQYWTSPGGNTPQSSSCTDTYHPSQKLSVRQTRHAGHCWRSRDEIISDVLLWIPSYGRAKAGWATRTYIQQLCEDMGCSPEDLPKVMNDREGWQERVRDICVMAWQDDDDDTMTDQIIMFYLFVFFIKDWLSCLNITSILLISEICCQLYEY